MIFRNFSKRQNLTITWWNRERFREYDGIICDGSIRSGKTVSMLLGFCIWAMSNFNNEKFAICGRTIESLRRNVVSNMALWLEGICEVREKRSENMIVLTNGETTNTIYLFGGKDESSYTLIQGITLAGVLLDEVALMPRSFVEQALGRCSVEGSKYWFNCNPESPQHWFYLEWIQKAKEKNILYLHFTMADNLSLSQKIRQRYEDTYSGVFYRRYILGQWVKAEGLVYPMFSREKHIVDYSGEYDRRHRYVLSIDYGTVNPFACGLFDYDPSTQTATMIRLLYHNGRSADRVDNEAYYRMVKQTAEGYEIDYLIIDPSAASMVETIQKYGEFIVIKANNDVMNGIQDTTKFLNAGRLLFDRSCEDAFVEFETYSWDDKSGEDRVIKTSDHAMDLIRYYVYTWLRNELKWVV